MNVAGVKVRTISAAVENIRLEIPGDSFTRSFHFHDSIDFLYENLSNLIQVTGETDENENTPESDTFSKEPDFFGDVRALTAIGDKIEVFWTNGNKYDPGRLTALTLIPVSSTSNTLTKMKRV